MTPAAPEVPDPDRTDAPGPVDHHPFDLSPPGGLEFFPVDATAWCETGVGLEERVLSRRRHGDLTRITRWRPGHDTSAAGVIRHDFYEQVYLLEGQLTDLTLGQTFGAGHYTWRPPGMPHGPYETQTGCTMLEVRSSC